MYTAGLRSRALALGYLEGLRFAEILGFYGLQYWYTWQVTVLGLGPIWTSDNEAIKKRAAEALQHGGIFARPLSSPLSESLQARVTTSSLGSTHNTRTTDW